MEKQMTHREILEALTGLLLAMFVAMISSTIVSNALPTIVADLGGSQTGYTWVVVATLLAATASTPIWGKLADLYEKKILVQAGLTIFLLGSLLAGLAHSMEFLIAARAVQGLGVGGLMALVQVVIAAMVPPRERGRYAGYIGGVFATATIAGPLIGGAIVDSPLGWRWCFFIGVPFALAAFVTLARTLHLPSVVATTRLRSIDWTGATLIAGGTSVLLAWISLGGSQFSWTSWISISMALGAMACLALAVLVEHRRGAEAIIPLALFKDRTTALATGASLMVGVALFGATVYLAQYFQLSRGMSPTHAGLMSVPTVGGLMLTSVISGRLITKTGRWKSWLVAGMTVTVGGLLLLGTIDAQTPLLEVAIFQIILGAGLGAVMQNMVLAVQNRATDANLGSASSLVAFFRSLGGSAGVAAMGAILTHSVEAKMTAGLSKLGIEATASKGAVPQISELPPAVRALYETAFGEGVAHVFLLAVPFAVAALICTLFIEEIPLRTTTKAPEKVVEPALETS